jgi:hypothetical protein
MTSTPTLAKAVPVDVLLESLPGPSPLDSPLPVKRDIFSDQMLRKVHIIFITISSICHA